MDLFDGCVHSLMMQTPEIILLFEEKLMDLTAIL